MSTAGRWVQRGLIRVWTGPRPTDDPDDEGDRCPDCNRILVARQEWYDQDADTRTALNDTHAARGRANGERCGSCTNRARRGTAA